MGPGWWRMARGREAMGHSSEYSVTTALEATGRSASEQNDGGQG